MKTKNSLQACNISALNFNQSIAEKVEVICMPLFQYFGITHFGYIKIFNNKTMLRMANNEKWTLKYFEKEFYNDRECYNISKISEAKPHFLLLTGEPQGEHFTSLCKEFDIWNALAIYEKFQDYTDFWFFATSQHNTEALNFYINNKEILRKFTLYFKSKLAEDIHNVKKEKLIHLKNQTPQNFDEDEDEDEKINNFFDKTNIKYYKINEDFIVSKKEFEVLYYLIQGKTIKEIARLGNVSFRTIEFHMENLKKKAACHKKSQLIDLCLKSTLFHSLLHKF